ncbi:MAG: hypothetical protein V2J55_09330 [Candidatus Competibacteraceae bacterium]|nr:hypothetical protein [Candidatus Competibacteraceae bacterium]
MILVLAYCLVIIGCGLGQGTYYPEGRGFPSRDQPAELTASSVSELEEQGYKQIGFITRLWDPEEEKEALFLDYRSDSDDLPPTDPFHKGFLASLREQAGQAGGDLLRPEPDGIFEDEGTVLIVNEAGSHWSEAVNPVQFKRLTWSVWRLETQPAGADNG